MESHLPATSLDRETPLDTGPRLFEVLTSLNQIGEAINQISPRDSLSVAARLNLIVESAIKVVPASSAVIYTYKGAAFDPTAVSTASLVPVPGCTRMGWGCGRSTSDAR
jgi:hypothetical protein